MHVAGRHVKHKPVTEAEPESTTHLLLVPAPLHRMETACGIDLKDVDDLDGKHYVASDTAKVTCKLCLVMTGREQLPWTPGLPEVKMLNIEGNEVMVTVGHRVAGVMAQMLYEDVKRFGAVNYLEYKFEFYDKGLDQEKTHIAVIVQKHDGKSPHDFRLEAEAARDAALAEVERLKAQLTELVGAYKGAT